MLLVKTSTGPSAIHGTGLFADEYIPAHTVVWTRHPAFDVTVAPADLAALPGPAKDAVFNFCYVVIDGGEMVMCGDNARYMNHHDAPNTACVGHGSVATRDIAPGEELTCDYWEFDALAAEKLGGVAAGEAREGNHLPEAPPDALPGVPAGVRVTIAPYAKSPSPRRADSLADTPVSDR